MTGAGETGQLSRHELARKIESVSRALLSEIPRGHKAYGWAIDLCALIGQTDACAKCGGRGTRARHHNCIHDALDSYVRGCHETILCRACLGCGRVPKVAAADLARGEQS